MDNLSHFMFVDFLFFLFFEKMEHLFEKQTEKKGKKDRKKECFLLKLFCLQKKSWPLRLITKEYLKTFCMLARSLSLVLKKTPQKSLVKP